MKILIIENEIASGELLEKMISEVRPGCSFFPLIGTVRDSVRLLSTAVPDLIFLDIELSDGNAFEIFNQVEVSTPVVFTTAYNQYMTDAFDNNGISYLLKPIRPEMVEKAFLNYEKNRQIFRASDLHSFSEQVRKNLSSTTYKKQFLVKQGLKLIPVRTSEINHFFSEKNLVSIVTTDNRRFMIDESLGDLEKLLDPSDFFRVNRKYLVSRNSIQSLNFYTKGQVAVKINLLDTEKIVVSRFQTPILKLWLDS